MYGKGLCDSKNMAIEALEKQIPMRCFEDNDKFYLCPKCFGSIDIYEILEHAKNDEISFCPHCGQAVDWSDYDDK